MGIKKLKEVYILHHVRQPGEEEEDVKLLGVFSSEELAQKSIEKYKKMEGFEDFQEGFSIDKYIVDKMEWGEGFIT